MKSIESLTGQGFSLQYSREHTSSTNTTLARARHRSIVEVPPERLRSMAQDLVGSIYEQVQRNPKLSQKGINTILVRGSFSPIAVALATGVMEEVTSRGVGVTFMPADGGVEDAVLNGLNSLPTEQAKQEAIRRRLEIDMPRMQAVDAVITVAELPKSRYTGDPKLVAYSRQERWPLTKEMLTKPWIVVAPPTADTARMDRIPLEQEVNNWLRACERPWEEVRKAHRKLARILDQGSELHVVANRDQEDPRMRTDLRVNIEGYQFIKSTIMHNYPGDELYTGGQDATGRFAIPHPLLFNGRRLPHLSLEFENNRIVRWYMPRGTAADKAFLEAQLALPGAKTLGEIALGTNYLEVPTLDISLLEKDLGVHIALGKSYEDPEGKAADDDGDDVHVDNGNRSPIHVDLGIRINRQSRGRIEVDGRPIQINGSFLIQDKGTGLFVPDPELAILSQP